MLNLQEDPQQLYNNIINDCYFIFVNCVSSAVKLIFMYMLSLRKDSDATFNYCDHQFVKQHDLLRELAIHLSSKAEVPIRKRLIINTRGEELPTSIIQVQEPMQARILSISTGFASLIP